MANFVHAMTNPLVLLYAELDDSRRLARGLREARQALGAAAAELRDRSAGEALAVAGAAVGSGFDVASAVGTPNLPGTEVAVEDVVASLQGLAPEQAYDPRALGDVLDGAEDAVSGADAHLRRERHALLAAAAAAADAAHGAERA